MFKVVSMEELVPVAVLVQDDTGKEFTRLAFVDRKSKKVYKAEWGMGDLLPELKTAIWEEYAKTIL